MTQKLLLVSDKNWADLASRASEDMIGSNELELNGANDKLLKMVFENGSRNRIGTKFQKRTLKVRTLKNAKKKYLSCFEMLQTLIQIESTR